MKYAFYLNRFLNDVQIVEKEVNMLDDYEDRIITPAMPPCMARFCCVLNFVIPGTGLLCIIMIVLFFSWKYGKWKDLTFELIPSQFDNYGY
jgi:hypothetical protein